MTTERAHVQRRNMPRRSVRRRSRDEEDPNFVVALDFGYSHDFTALVLLERVEYSSEQFANNDDPAENSIKFHVGHLKRFPLGTQVHDIISFVSQLMARRSLAGRTGLIVDATGGGIPIVQEMRRCGLRPVPVTITAGVHASRNNVPKRDLMSRLLLILQHRRLRIPRDVKMRAELVEEFENFTVKFKSNGRATYSAAAGAHDDLIMALSLACHFFESRRGVARVHATLIGPTFSSASARLDLQRMFENRLLYR